MTLLSEKVKYNLDCEAKLYKEWILWGAYEQSAYVCLVKSILKPTKKYYKSINAEGVQIGFPEVIFF